MIILNREIIEGLLVPEEMIKAVENAFRAYGQKAFVMPERFGFEKDGKTLLYMPCFTEQVFGTKLLTLVPENRVRKLPAIDGMVVLNDLESGQVRALLDGKSVTAWRTGATGALAARKFSNPKAEGLGIVGCGIQGFHQAACISAVRKIRRLYLLDTYKTSQELEQFAEKLKVYCQDLEDVIVCADSRELLEGSDIVVTTTFSTEPVLADDEGLLKGKCFLAVGSYKPYMQELPDALFKVADEVYADLEYACEESGDLSQRIENGLLHKEGVRLLHQVLDREVCWHQGKTVVFKTVGMALVDIYAAEYLASKASEEQKGIHIEF